jgi:hypothetical protein
MEGAAANSIETALLKAKSSAMDISVVAWTLSTGDRLVNRRNFARKVAFGAEPVAILPHSLYLLGADPRARHWAARARILNTLWWELVIRS